MYWLMAVSSSASRTFNVPEEFFVPFHRRHLRRFVEGVVTSWIGPPVSYIE